MIHPRRLKCSLFGCSLIIVQVLLIRGQAMHSVEALCTISRDCNAGDSTSASRFRTLDGLHEVPACIKGCAVNEDCAQFETCEAASHKCVPNPPCSAGESFGHGIIVQANGSSSSNSNGDDGSNSYPYGTSRSPPTTSTTSSFSRFQFVCLDGYKTNFGLQRVPAICDASTGLRWQTLDHTPLPMYVYRNKLGCQSCAIK